MLLTKTGEKVLYSMMNQYEAEQIFYASMNKGKAGSSKWHKKKSLGKSYSSEHVKIARKMMK